MRRRDEEDVEKAALPAAVPRQSNRRIVVLEQLAQNRRALAQQVAQLREAQESITMF